VDEKDEAVPLGNVSLIARAMSWIRSRSRRSTTQTAQPSVPADTSEPNKREHLVVATILPEAKEHEDHCPGSTAMFDQPDNAGGSGPAPSQNRTGMSAGVLDSSLVESVQLDSQEPSSDQATQPDPSPTDAESQLEKAKWSQITMMSAFYIVMGGFAYDVSDTIIYDSSDYNYAALTPEGFLKFAQAGLLTPEILNNKDIADRSKADSLGKLLVCVQALWMVINCIARKAQGLPNTLVELNVIVHVVVAVVVYGLWWEKPLAVSQPTFLSRRRAGDNHPDNAVDADLFAFRITCQRLDITRGPFHNHATPATINYGPIRVPSTVVTPDSLGVQIWEEPIFSEWWTPKRVQKHLDQLKITSPGILLLSGQILEIKNAPATVWVPIGVIRFFTKKTLDKLSKDIVRYETPVELNADQTAILGTEPDLFDFTTKDPSNYIVKGSVYTGRVGEDGDEFYLMLLAWFLSAVYAGAHASAWSSHFPSYMERWIWRGSCISIASAIPILWSVFTGGAIVFEILNIMTYNWASWQQDVLLLPLAYFGIGLLGAVLISYVSARCFILVESFISMRSLPVGAYDTIEWTGFWPHV
jgi:hypothetical protein